ncbi:MAG: hypothetical protein IPK08_11795 [Bacteroidetes bacterium]|nr:hypothetical protein [Bacteroidota bacterium]
MYEDYAQIGFVLSVITITFLILILLLINLMLSSRNKKLRHKAELLQAYSHQREVTEAARMEVAVTTFGDISRDLHDEVGQLLTFSILQLEYLSTKPEQERQALIDEVKQSVRDSLDAIRTISRGLNPDFIHEQGLLISLEHLVHRAKHKTGISIDLIPKQEINDLPATTAVIVYRIIRECITNSVRHGQATKIEISFSITDNENQVIISDNGNCTDVITFNSAGLGAKSMNYYASLINGNVTFKNNS